MRPVRFILAVLYPLMVYIAVTRWSARMAGIVVVLGGLFTLLTNLTGRQGKEPLRMALPLLPAILLGTTTAFLNDERFLLVAPVIASLFFFAVFAMSLRPGEESMIEQFALAIRGSLDDARRRHCREVTAVWCAFFLLNAVVAALLASYAPLGWWAAYTGGLAYVAIGAVFAWDFWLRRRRFPSSQQET